MRCVLFSVIVVSLVLVTPACKDHTQDLPAVSYCMEHWTKTLHFDNRIDILLVIDNAGSMVDKQAQLVSVIGNFVDKADEYFGLGHYRIAVITTGMGSDGCQPCNDTKNESCINETGESGIFQNQVGHITWSEEKPVFTFKEDESCRVVVSDNIECLYNHAEDWGTALVGISGCPYRRGLAAMKQALQPGPLSTYNTGFFREDVPLAVVLISDGEDCGEPGEVTEGLPGVDEKICSYAAKGIGPDGGTFHPYDPDSKPYQLTAVEEYYDFLINLKDNRQGMVKFAAIVGVKDVEDPSSITIEYAGTQPDAAVSPACTITECLGESCEAQPGTRAIRLAQMFKIGLNGFVGSICQKDFSDTLSKLVTYFSCSSHFYLSKPLLDPSLAVIMINGEPLPAYSCNIQGQIVPCDGPEDSSCPASDCVKTWSYFPPESLPNPLVSHGEIGFADHWSPCEFLEYKHPITAHIDLVYVTECN